MLLFVTLKSALLIEISASLPFYAKQDSHKIKYKNLVSL